MIVFIDETGFSFQVGTGTTWAPKGRTPELRRVSKRHQVSTAIGLTASGGVYKKHFDHAIHGEDTVAHLEHLCRQVRGPKILIWDRLQAHRSAVVNPSYGAEAKNSGLSPVFGESLDYISTPACVTREEGCVSVVTVGRQRLGVLVNPPQPSGQSQSKA